MSHPSILMINDKNNSTDNFTFKSVTENEVYKLLKSLDAKKAIGVDGIPPSIVKISAGILAKSLTKIINQSISENNFPSSLKIASILPLFKKDERSDKKNYRPVSVLSSLSKIFGKVFQNQIIEYIDNKLSMYISAYRKGHSTQHVLMRMIEDWKKSLDNNKYVGAILMDLSKAFDCISHDLLIAKLRAYGFEMSSLRLIYSYLKGRRQCVKINGTTSKYMTIKAGVPQGSILGPILFNIFINDFYYFFEHANLYGFADDNSLSSASNILDDLITTLSSESGIALKWLKENEMIANPSKFQAIILSKSKIPIIKSIQIGDKTIESKKTVELLGVEVDFRLNFESHINNLCTKAGGQLNSLFRFKKFLSSDSKKLCVNSFILSNFSYCSLVWHFCKGISNNKIENVQKRSYRLLNENSEKLINVESSMEIRRLRSLAIEIYKTLNNFNPQYIKSIFDKNKNRTSNRLSNNLNTNKFNSVKYGRNSLRSLGPILWNSLPNNVRSFTSIDKFKGFMKNWGKKDCPHYSKFISYYQAIK